MMLVTLRDPLAASPADPEDPDPETAYRLALASGWDEGSAVAFAAWMLDLPTAHGEAGPILWTMRELRHLRYQAVRAAMGDFAGSADR